MFTFLLAFGFGMASTVNAQETMQISLSSLPAQASAPLSPAHTLKAETQLVVLDLVVKDKKGVAVHRFKPGDFTVKENGHTQPVHDFEEHTALSPAELAQIPTRPQLPAGEFTNFVATPPTGALNTLLTDELNTAVRDQRYMRQQLIDYLQHSPDSRMRSFALVVQGRQQHRRIAHKAQQQFQDRVGWSISVKIEGKPYILNDRHGFFVDHSRKHVHAGMTGAETLTPSTSLEQALLFGSPQPIQVLLRAKAFTVGTADHLALMEGNQPNLDPKKNHPP